MFRLYSKGCEYALRALLHLSPSDGYSNVAVKTACRRAGIPESFTRKIFQALVKANFLKAVRGPGGGYALTRSPKRITLRSVIEAVDGETTFRRCVLGLPVCHDQYVCPLHPTWVNVKRRLLSELEATTLQDLIDAVKS